MAKIVVEMSGDEQKLFRSLQKVIDQQDKADRKFDKMGQTARRASDMAVKGADRQQVSTARAQISVSKLAASYVTMSTGIGLATSALQFMRAEADKAVNSMESLEDANRRLSQVSLGPADTAREIASRRALATEFAVPLQDVAAVQFAARSEGFGTGTTRTILRGAPAFGTEAAASVAGQLPKLFAGSGLTGAQAINLTAEAARQSRSDFETIGRTFATAAEGSGQAGSSPSETGALLSVLSSKFASPEAAAARIKALGSAFSLDKDLAGGGITSGVQSLLVGPEDRRRKLLGSSQELNSAFSRIAESLDEIAKVEKDIAAAVARTGTADSPVSRAVASRLSNPLTGRAERAQLERRRSEIAREIATLGLSESENASTTAINRSITELKGRPGTGLQQFISQTVGETLRFLGVGAGGISAGISTQQAIPGALPAAIEALSTAAAELKGGAVESRAATRFSSSNINAEREQLRGVE